MTVVRWVLWSMDDEAAPGWRIGACRSGDEVFVHVSRDTESGPARCFSIPADKAREFALELLALTEVQPPSGG